MLSEVRGSPLPMTGIAVPQQNKIAPLSVETSLRRSKSSPWVQSWLSREQRQWLQGNMKTSFASQVRSSKIGASLYIDDNNSTDNDLNSFKSTLPIHPLA